MIHFFAGAVFGTFLCVVFGLAGCCIYFEKKYPKTFAQFRAEMLEAEGDDIW